MKLRLLYADLWLQRNQWRVFVALSVIALAVGIATISHDNPTNYAASSAARG